MECKWNKHIVCYESDDGKNIYFEQKRIDQEYQCMIYPKTGRINAGLFSNEEVVEHMIKYNPKVVFNSVEELINEDKPHYTLKRSDIVELYGREGKYKILVYWNDFTTETIHCIITDNDDKGIFLEIVPSMIKHKSE